MKKYMTLLILNVTQQQLHRTLSYILVNSPLNTFLFVIFTQNILKLRQVDKHICSHRS